MDKHFEKFLTCLNNSLIKETRDYIKTNERLLFAKLCVINFCDIEGFDMKNVLKVVRKADEETIVAYINPELYDKEINTVEDIINVFSNDMSNIDYFLWSYCYYNDYTIDNLYFENVERGNVDGVFEVMSRDEKAEVLSNISNEINLDIKSIYTNDSLTNVWNKFNNDNKKKAFMMWF